MTIFRSLLAAAVILLIESHSSVAQTQLATGAQPFGSFTPMSFETFNNGNLNMHFEIPIVAKSGRGMSFSYSLAYDSSVWSPTSSSGSGTWVPQGTWGWSAITQATLGYISYTFTPSSAVCGPPGTGTTYWAVAAGFVYHDTLGASHAFNGAAIYNSNAHGGGTAGCGPADSESLSAVASDGSGYQLSVGINGDTSPQNVFLTSLRARSGTSIAAPLITGSNASGSVTDTNGNETSVAYNAGTTTFTDTLGTTALTVTGSGTASSPLVYQYTNPGGTTSKYTVNYTNQTVKTNFGCSGTGEYGGTIVPLVSSVVLPDGTQYTFGYETTQGPSGYTTGRLSWITLPTGGTVDWLYYSGSTPANTITCADGSGMNIQRVSTDGVASFSRVESPSWQTIYTDGLSNDTVMAFQSQTLSNTIYSYETQRQTYQGSHTSGALLQTVNTGYNGSSSSSPCVAGTLSLPISQVEVSTTWPYTVSGAANNIQSQVCSNYDTANAGRLTQTTQYSYGSPGTLGTSIKSQTSYSYASLGNGIYTDPSEIIVTDGTTTYADTQYQYDQGSVVTTTGTPQHVSISGSRGNPTTIKQLTTGTSYLTTTQTFFDTGNIQTVTDPNQPNDPGLQLGQLRQFVSHFNDLATLPLPFVHMELQRRRATHSDRRERQYLVHRLRGRQLLATDQHHGSDQCDNQHHVSQFPNHRGILSNIQRKHLNSGHARHARFLWTDAD